MELDARASIRDHDELRRTGPVLVVTVLAFFAHQALHIEPATVALAGAAVGLFVTTIARAGALEDRVANAVLLRRACSSWSARSRRPARSTRSPTGSRTSRAETARPSCIGILWIGGVGSGLVDNIPFTTAMIPVVKELQGRLGDNAYWWALSLGACFGGNATIIAAAANVAAAGLTERAGKPIGFVAFLRIGIPVTMVSLADRVGLRRLRYMALLGGAVPDSIVKQDDHARSSRFGADDRSARRPEGDRHGLPGLPVVEDDGNFAGIFGEREFMARSSPASRELASSAMIKRSIDDAIDRRELRAEPISKYLTTDHVLVEDDYSDTQLAELFLHHRVLVIPIATEAGYTPSSPAATSSGPSPSAFSKRRARSSGEDCVGLRHSDEVSLVQELSKLESVGCRALAQVVADDPHVQALIVRGIAADAADEHVVASGHVGRQRVDTVAG